jgi:hypothetical protein
MPPVLMQNGKVTDHLSVHMFHFSVCEYRDVFNADNNVYAGPTSCWHCDVCVCVGGGGRLKRNST